MIVQIDRPLRSSAIRRVAWLLLALDVLNISYWIYGLSNLSHKFGLVYTSISILKQCYWWFTASTFWTLAIAGLVLLPGRMKWFSIVPFVAAICSVPVIGIAALLSGSNISSEMQRIQHGSTDVVVTMSHDQHCNSGTFAWTVVQERQIIPGIALVWHVQTFDWNSNFSGLRKEASNKIVAAFGSGNSRRETNLMLPQQ